ncbi:MAG: hypothetical protein EBR95_03125 [Verrucomicrobia bacterium]|nr:hypothetical protein [Verrucomicrobiota bacterium]
MDAPKPLADQLAECEQWCVGRSEKEYVPVAEEGLRILPAHHAELATPLPGQEALADGWRLRWDVISAGMWLLFGVVLLSGVAMIYVTVFDFVDNTAYPFLYAGLLALLPSAAVVYLPLRVLLRSYELVFGDEALIVRRRVFRRLDAEWRLPLGDEVRVGLAYRGVRARYIGKSGGNFAQLSIVVSCRDGEIVFGTDLGHEQRARLAILIDHHFNGTEEIPRGV